MKRVEFLMNNSLAFGEKLHTMYLRPITSWLVHFAMWLKRRVNFMTLKNATVQWKIYLKKDSKSQCVKMTQKNTLGQKPTFYPEITKHLMFEKCKFCEK